ncbi:uncharacterized protein [Magallana gigas]|uniref:uncharacterized protein n=1 Tax=Magallana gigas TaxID=29159 RepID=UPI003340E428
MYSQSRSSGINLGESEDAQFKQEWKQQKTKMCAEEHMLVSSTEKHQNNVNASPKLQSFNYPYSPTSLDQGIKKGTITNGYENVCHSGDNGSIDSSEDNNGPVSDTNYYVSCEFSSDIYENDTFRTYSEFDRSSVILERSDDFLSDNKHQLWTDNITGGTSKKEYIDMNLYRPTFQHDSSNSLENARRIGFIENRSVEKETQNLYQNEKRNDKKTNKTGLVVILGILLIACIAGVLAWFLAKKGDDEFSVKYYVVNGEMALKNEFYPALSDSSSKEFKDLALQFCGAMTDALRKNDTKFGFLYRHCDVTKFRNGSIIVQYRLYYQYYEIQITKEKVFQDLKKSLTDIDSGLANFSVFVIIKASVSFLVEVQTFKTDPFAIDAHLITSTTITAATEQKTTTKSTNFTTKDTSEYPRVSTTMTTSDYPTALANTVERFAESTTVNERERSTISRTIHTTEISKIPTNLETSERIRSTTFSATATIIEYSADVVVSPMIAIYGETTTTKTCVVSPHGDWVHVTVTVENQGTSYVIGKYHSDNSFKEPVALERLSASISSTNTDIELYLSLDLQAPTTDMCSWNRKYTFLCSITMNDSISTRVYKGSQIYITAPMSDVSIDSNVHYNEGEKMTFNCSMKGDPNYSTAYVELIKNSKILYTIPGPVFGTDYISNCSVVLNWSDGPPTPLTSQEHDLIVRCVVKNNLLNETRNSKKKLNVPAADVAFQKYSYQALTTSRQEIECIARSPMSILQELIISKDDIQIAAFNSSGVASSTDRRFSTNIQEYNGGVRFTLSILSVECKDQGRYNCKLITTNYTTRVSPKMSFIVEGSKPIMKLHPDIYEPFARRGLNHICSTEHVGDENNDNFLEIQIFQPGSQRAFTYSNKIAEVEKMFDSTNNITYINITGTTAQFLLVSHTSSSSNQSCNIKETITFLLDLTMEFNNGTIKCVLKDEMEEFSAVESRITVIPGNFCDGYEHRAFRKHPNTDCNDYIECTEYQGKMYATGNQCPLGQCIKFITEYCVPCDSTFTCDELTTTGPTTTTTTLPPGRRCVAFQKYSYQALTTSRQEIECIARSPMSILQELIISKDGTLIATLNSSGVASSTDGRYSTNIQEYDGEVRLTLSILSVDCQDQGRYNCKLITTNNATLVSPNMSFIVEGSKPTMTLHPDIYEPFARRHFNHICSTEHTGDDNNDNFLEIQIFQPGSQRAFTYSKKIAEVEKMFDSTNNITYINITGTTAQFLLVSHTSSSSNLSCNIKETITFLLDLKMDFDNGTIKCVLKDEMEEFSAVESKITVIPGNFCDGYEHGAYRKHPNNDCNDFIDCNEIQGKMYAIGNQCHLGQCFQFSLGYCVPCDSTFTCDELTTPGPTTTTTTLPPGRRYVSCNDSAHFLGTTAVIRCNILDTSFNSLNITFLPEQSQNEEYVGEIFPDGQIQSLPQSPVVLSTNFDLSPKILMFTFQLLECSSRGRYRIIAGGTNSSVAPSVETFELNVLGNLTEFEMHIEPAYPEGTLVEYNCTASLDESYANIKGYYKKESESSFSEIEGSTSVIERNLSLCFVKVLWKPSTPFTADTSFNNADLKCELVDWPLVQRTKKISVQNADVAFETYKLESSIGSQVSVKCFARNTNSIKSILIRKIENSVNTTVANVTLPDMTSHVDGIIVSYSNNSLTLTFSSLTCSDDGQYTCIVINEDGLQIESPAYLRVQIKNPPKHEKVAFILNPDIKENKYDTSNVHTCSGDVGYPSGLGYLSLKFTDPTTNASFTYDKMTVTEDMKISVDSPLKFKVSLSSGLSIIIVEDDEPDIVNCTRKKEIKFLLQATRDWNRAKIRCRVISETNEVNSTSAEKELYVIPDSVCDGSNGSDIYVPLENIDECRTYIRCFNNKPTGQKCGTADLCFDHQKNYCDWCRVVACESEMSSTTESQITTTSSLPAVPEIQCPLLSCKRFRTHLQGCTRFKYTQLNKSLLFISLVFS